MLLFLKNLIFHLVSLVPSRADIKAKSETSTLLLYQRGRRPLGFHLVMDCGTRINHPRHDDVVLLKRRAARWSDLPEGVKHSIFDYVAPLQYLFVAGVSREFKQLYEEHRHGDKRTSLPWAWRCLEGRAAGPHDL